MCLAVPGKILSITDEDDALLCAARVNFGGIVKEISLAGVPEAKIGDYVIVHAGFALARLDEQEAQQVFATLRQMEQQVPTMMRQIKESSR